MDPRILEAYNSLRSLVEERVEGPVPAAVPWHTTQVPIPLDSDEVSGTDMLALWLPDMATESTRAHPWEAYFRGEAPPVGISAAGDTEATAPPLFSGPLPKPSFSPQFKPPEPLTTEPPATELLVAEDHLEDSEAAAAVDGLYAFIHAIGRLDIDGAMACVADGYHCIEGDRAVDRRSFRLWLDALLDRLRGFDEFEAFLAEIPEPISHPRGVLIHCLIQIDGRSEDNTGSESKSSIQLERLALLNREPNGTWTLDAFGLVEGLRS